MACAHLVTIVRIFINGVCRSNVYLISVSRNLVTHTLLARSGAHTTGLILLPGAHAIACMLFFCLVCKLMFGAGNEFLMFVGE